MFKNLSKCCRRPQRMQRFFLAIDNQRRLLLIAGGTKILLRLKICQTAAIWRQNSHRLHAEQTLTMTLLQKLEQRPRLTCFADEEGPRSCCCHRAASSTSACSPGGGYARWWFVKSNNANILKLQVWIISSQLST